MFSLGPVPDIFAQVSSPVVRGDRKAWIGAGDNERRDQGNPDGGGAVGWTDDLRLGNWFSRLLIHNVRKAKVLHAPSECGNLQYIDLHDKQKSLPGLYIVIDLQ